MFYSVCWPMSTKCIRERIRLQRQSGASVMIAFLLVSLEGNALYPVEREVA